MARLLDNLPEPPPIPAGVEIREAIEESSYIVLLHGVGACPRNFDHS